MKTLEIRGFVITPTGKEHAQYSVYGKSHLNMDGKIPPLSEDVCDKMCDKIDRGERYANGSRYIFQSDSLKDSNGIQFGTARAVIQKEIRKYYGDGVYFVRINKL